MILLLAATAMEIAPAQEALADYAGVDFLQGGVGILETAVCLTERLQRSDVSLVINFGVCGAYLASHFPLLHLCVADQECVADLGVCYGDDFSALPDDLPVTPILPADPVTLAQCQEWLTEQGTPFTTCSFATVNGVSGTAVRGNMLASTHNVSCENMEGAAMARVASRYAVPWLEIRTVSNQVEDRNPAVWKLQEASAKCADIVTTYCRNILELRSLTLDP